MGNENKINNVTIALTTERPPKQLTDRPIIKTYKVASLLRISQVIASLKRNDGIDYHSLISFNSNTLNIFYSVAIATNNGQMLKVLVL